MKPLLCQAALLLVCALHAPAPAEPTASNGGSPPTGVIQIPVEVVAEGSSPRWVEVRVPMHSVPEPEALPLLLLPTLWLLLRRQR